MVVNNWPVVWLMLFLILVLLRLVDMRMREL